MNIYNIKTKYLSLFLITFFSFVILFFSNSNFIYFRIFITFLIATSVIESIQPNFKLRISPFVVTLSTFALLNTIYFKVFFESFYVLFFFSLLIFFHHASFYLTRNEKAEKYLKAGFVFLLIFSLLLIIVKGQLFDLGLRFSGFSASATTFSTYLLAVFIVYLFLEKDSRKKKYAILFTLFLVILSQTRISFFLFVFLLLIYFYRHIVNRHLKLAGVLAAILSISFFPAVSVASAYVSLDPTGRYDEVDYSTFTRLTYLNNQAIALEQANLFNIILGHGVNTSENVGGKFSSSVIDQHNDFFTLIYDFGALFALGFIVMLLKAIKNPLSLAICVIYLFSFYHNMLYDIFLLFMIFLTANLHLRYKPLSPTHETRSSYHQI